MEVKVNQTEDKTGISIWQVLIGVIISPGKTFEKLGQVTEPIKPALLLSFLAIVLNVLFYSKFSEILINLASQNLDHVTAHKSFTSGVIYIIVAMILRVFLGPIIIAALLKLLNFIMGEKTQYKQLWCVTVFSSVPLIVGLLIEDLLLFIVNGNNVLTTFSFMSTPFVISILADSFDVFAIWSMVLTNAFDVFVIWSLVLTTIGTAKLFRIKALKVGIVIVGVWLVTLLLPVYFWANL